MAPYYALVLIPLVITVLQKSRFTLKAAKHTAAINVYFMLFFFMLALRNISIGTDLLGYEYYFRLYANAELGGLPLNILQMGAYDVEPGYIILNWLVGGFTNDYQWLLVTAALISLLPIALLYREDDAYPFLKIILFMTVCVFSLFFSGLRQAIAISVGTIAYRFVRKKKIVPFLIAVAAAVMFHRSALILVALYPAYHVRVMKKHLFFIIPVIVLIFIFNKMIFGFFQPFLVGRYVSNDIESTGAYGMLILFAIFCIFCYVIGDEAKMDGETIGLRNLMLLILVFQMAAPLNSLAMRINYYFMIYIPILIPRIIKYSKQSRQQIAYMAGIVMCGFFTAYYFINMYLGEDILNLYPYIPFWK